MGNLIMKVIVYHNAARDERGRPLGMLDGYQAEHPVTPVAAYEVPDGTPALEEAFRVFNVGDDPDFGEPDPRAVEYRQRGNRSLSVGDVVQLDGTFYSCDHLGWGEILPPRIEAVASYGTAPIAARVPE